MNTTTHDTLAHADTHAIHADDVAVFEATCTLIEQGDVTRALEIAAAHWQQRPASAGASFNYGFALQHAGRHGDAIVPYRRALDLAPRLPSLKSNLSIAVRLSGGDADFEHALIEGALDDDPNDALAWINAVIARIDRYDLDGALRAAARAVALAPDNALAHNNMATALKEAARWDEAEHHARRALAIEPHSASYRFNLSLLHLSRGDHAAGWAGHEARWNGSDELRGTHPSLPAPRWQGESLAGKTLLVWGEQGIGDMLQFCRYVPLLAERVHREGGRLVWNSFPVLDTLVGRSLGRHADAYTTVTDVRQLPACDYELPLMSLPWVLGLDADTLATPTPYLHADAAALDGWRARLAAEKRLKVGLAWTGSLTHQRNSFRRVGLDRYAEAFAGLQDDVAFYSLQPGAQQDVAAARAAGFEIDDYTNEWRSFDDTAAFVGALDLVITVCTSVAHLSGALGQFTWVLLDGNPHWVWGREQRDSLYYPSASLYRQQTFADWAPVLDEVALDLRGLVA